MKRRTSFKEVKVVTVIPAEFWAHKLSRAGGVHAVSRWTALPSGERDAVLREDAHLVGGALHRDVLVGPELLGVGVGAAAGHAAQLAFVPGTEGDINLQIFSPRHSSDQKRPQCESLALSIQCR